MPSNNTEKKPKHDEEDIKKFKSEVLPIFDHESIQYDADGLFCYFLDNIAVPPNNIPMVNLKEELKTDVISQFEAMKDSITITSSFSEASNQIKSAVDFLEKAARSERTKEMRVINNYLEEIKKSPIIQELAKKQKFASVDDMIHSMNEYAEGNNFDVPDFSEIDKFYKNLTILLNSVKQRIEEFKQRIGNLKTRVKGKDTTPIYARYFAFRLPSDINPIINFIKGTGRGGDEDSFSSTVRKLLLDYLFKIDIAKTSTRFLDNPVASIAAMLIDFEAYINSHWAQDNSDLTFDKYALEHMDELFPNWLDQSTAVINRILDSRDQAIQEEIDSLSQEIGLDLSEVKKVTKQTQQQTRRQLQQGTNYSADESRRRKYFQQALQAATGASLQSLSKIKATIINKANNYHGQIFEHLWALIQQGFKVRGSAAVDTLALGQLGVNFSTDINAQEAMKSISQAFTTFATKETDHEFDSLKPALDEENKQLEDAINKLEQQVLNSQTTGQDLFVYHESLKLYLSMERTKDKSDEFEGRNLKILKAIQYLYDGLTLGGKTTFSGIDMNTLSSIALNLTSVGQGAEVGLQEPLEQYFAIFAGLLMFDDIRQIALDAQKQITAEVGQQNGVYQIHLYLANGVFVPSSYLLSMTAHAIQQGLNHFNKQTTYAAVEISTGKLDSFISSQYIPSTTKPYSYQGKDGWDVVADEAQSETKIRITFLYGFIEFIQSLDTLLNGGG